MENAAFARHSVGAGNSVGKDCMRGIRHCLIAACCCGWMLAPLGASGSDWPANQPQSGDRRSVRRADPRPRTLPGDSGRPGRPVEPLCQSVPRFAGGAQPLLPRDRNRSRCVHSGDFDSAPRKDDRRVGLLVHRESRASQRAQLSRVDAAVRVVGADRAAVRLERRARRRGKHRFTEPGARGLVSAPNNPFNPIGYQNGFLWGSKLRLIDQSDWIPAATVIIQGYKPTLGDTRKVQTQATCIVGWELSPRWRLDAALQYATGVRVEGRLGHMESVGRVPRLRSPNAGPRRGRVLSSASSREASREDCLNISPARVCSFLITPDAASN